jgi:hypothetical protein
VTGIALRTVLGFLRRRARHEGVVDGRSGAVVVIQRFGGALNLNVHLHALVLDGVFAVDGRVALGPRAGARVRQCGVLSEDVAPTTLGPCHARVDGFDLHAGLVTRSGQPDRVERLCRYALRPPLAQDRLHVSAEGTIWLTLRHCWADGTTHLRFDPLERLERLAVLTPRPRVNLILSPRAAWRAALVGGTSHGVDTPHREPSAEGDEDISCTGPSRPGAYQWAELMRRTFGVEVLACPRCGGRPRLVAPIEQASVVQRI